MINVESPESKAAAPVALYHGACPVCGTEIDHYRKYCDRNAIVFCWEDISDGTTAPLLERLDLNREDAKRRMTVLMPDGTVYRGVDAFIALWREMPRYRLLAKAVALPGIYHAGRLIYDHVLAPMLYAWNKRSGR